MYALNEINLIGFFWSLVDQADAVISQSSITVQGLNPIDGCAIVQVGWNPGETCDAISTFVGSLRQAATDFANSGNEVNIKYGQVFILPRVSFSPPYVSYPAALRRRLPGSGETVLRRGGRKGKRKKRGERRTRACPRNILANSTHLCVCSWAPKSDEWNHFTDVKSSSSH